MMKSKIVLCCLVSVSCFLLNGNLSAQKQSTVEQTLSKYLEIQSKRIGFSGVVMVSNEDGVLSLQTVGLASRELDVRFSADFKFKIASITKSFTGLLLTLAEREGRLQFENNLGSYYPEIKNELWKNITIKQLLSHTSGIPHWSAFNEYWQVKSWLPINQEQVLDEIFKMELLFEPGSSASYSSPAFYLLATILEKVYATSYQNLIRKKILDPLKLKNTNVFDGLTVMPKMSSGYHLISDDSLIVAPPRSMATMKGGGDLFSTASDLTIWCKSFLSNEVWGTTIVNATFLPITTHKMPHKHDASYGRGWYLSEADASRPTSYHIGGGTFGFSSKVAIYPSEKVSIVILSNVSFLPMDDVLWRDIENIVFERPFELPKSFPESTLLSSDELKMFTGAYLAKNSMRLDVIMHEAKLYAKLGRNPPFELYAKSPNSFFSKKINVQFLFQRDGEDKVIGLVTKGKGRVDNFDKQ